MGHQGISLCKYSHEKASAALNRSSSVGNDLLVLAQLHFVEDLLTEGRIIPWESLSSSGCNLPSGL